MPLLRFKWVFLLVLTLVAAVLLGPLRERFLGASVTIGIAAYGLALLGLGLYVLVTGRGPADRAVANAGFGGLLLAPIYLASGLTFALAGVAGIFVLARKRWAVIVALIAQAILFFAFPPYLMLVGAYTPGYHVLAVDWKSYGVACAVILAATAWFFTRPRVKARFARRGYP